MAEGSVTLVRDGARLVAREPAAREALESSVEDGQGLKVAHASRGLLVAVNDRVSDTILASLDAVSPVEVLTILTSATRTGVITVQSTAGSRQLFLQGGRYVGSMSTVVADRLGEVLWRTGQLSLDQVMIAAAQTTREKKLGRVLVELGYITPQALREALREQAKAVFEAACLEDRGVLTFHGGVRHPSPIAIADSSDALLDQVLEALSDVERLMRVVGDLDNEVSAVVPAPEAKLSDAAQATLQLVLSRRASSFTKRELVERSGLGRRLGLRALEELLVVGALEEEERTPPVPERPRAERIVEALRLIVDVLEREAPTVLITIDDWLREPPARIAPILASLGFVALDRDALASLAEQLHEQGGAADHAFVVVTDFALFEATDALPRDEGQALSDQVRALGIL